MAPSKRQLDAWIEREQAATGEARGTLLSRLANDVNLWTRFEREARSL